MYWNWSDKAKTIDSNVYDGDDGRYLFMPNAQIPSQNLPSEIRLLLFICFTLLIESKRKTAAFWLEMLTTLWRACVCVCAFLSSFRMGYFFHEWELNGVRNFHSMEMGDRGCWAIFCCLVLFCRCWCWRRHHFILLVFYMYDTCMYELCVAVCARLCLNVHSLLSTVLIYYLPYLCLSNQISNSNHMYNNSISCMLAITPCNCTVYTRERTSASAHADCQHECDCERKIPIIELYAYMYIFWHYDRFHHIPPSIGANVNK